MKRFRIGLLLLTIAGIVYPQVPNAFNYQAVLRNSDGTVKANETVALQISLIDDNGSSSYIEIHNTQTNELGLINVVIGEGVTSGDFSIIDWSAKPYYLDITLNGVNLGSSPLLSVPYAMHANSASKVNSETDPLFTDWDRDYGDLINRPTQISDLSLNANNGTITNLADPVNDQDAANKSYVDTQIKDNPKHYIGESYGGGIVFWVDESGEHGLIASPGDLVVAGNPFFPWSSSDIGTGAFRDGIGAGKYNTDLIISIHGYGNYAAYKIFSTIVPVGGYGDWYLPSKYELNLLYTQRAFVKISNGGYWSSNQKDVNNAWYQNFSTGEQLFALKIIEVGRRVRPIRSF